MWIIFFKFKFHFRESFLIFKNLQYSHTLTHAVSLFQLSLNIWPAIWKTRLDNSGCKRQKWKTIHKIKFGSYWLWFVIGRSQLANRTSSFGPFRTMTKFVVVASQSNFLIIIWMLVCANIFVFVVVHVQCTILSFFYFMFFFSNQIRTENLSHRLCCMCCWRRHSTQSPSEHHFFRSSIFCFCSK